MKHTDYFIVSLTLVLQGCLSLDREVVNVQSTQNRTLASDTTEPLTVLSPTTQQLVSNAQFDFECESSLSDIVRIKFFYFNNGKSFFLGEVLKPPYLIAVTLPVLPNSIDPHLVCQAEFKKGPELEAYYYPPRIASPSATPSPTPSPTSSPVASPKPSPIPSPISSPVASPKPSPIPSTTVTPTPTVTPTSSPVVSPTPSPSVAAVDLAFLSSMYVYDKDMAVTGTTAQRDAVLNFAKTNKITTLYLSADQYFITSSLQGALTSFIQVAKANFGISTVLLLSNYNWSLSVNHSAALARTKSVLNYLATLPSGAIKPIAIQYDVEPHALSNWNSEMNSVANQYLDFESLIVNETHGLIPVQFVTSYFYGNKQITRNGVTKPFSHFIIDGLDSTGAIVIMNYRDNIAYSTVESNSGVLSVKSYSNQILGSDPNLFVTDDIAYASISKNAGKRVFQVFNTHKKTATEFGVTETQCASVMSLNSKDYSLYGAACNSYWEYKSGSFGEEGKAALLRVGPLLKNKYVGSPAYSAYAGWGVFAYSYFSLL